MTMKRQNVRLTERDLKVVDWLKTVRIADMEGVRAGLEAFSDGRKQSLRLAYRWVERMKLAGLVKAETPFYGAGQICWVTPQGGGISKPNLLSQVSRHDVQVSRVSALWCGLGWIWQLDDSEQLHRADGIAVSPSQRIAIEVELTAKESKRMQEILVRLYRRVSSKDLSEIWYYCTPSAAAAIRKANEVLAKNHNFVFGQSLKVVEHFDALGQPKEKPSNEQKHESGKAE